MRRLVVALAPLLLTLEAPALAQAPQWRISEVSGDVRITEGGRGRAAIRGALLSSGSTIATAARARAVLVRGREYVVVSPNSRLRIPDAQQQGGRGFIQMLTDWGTALFRIERRATPHFGVQTPYLAAVVKGTVFTVTVGPSGASVQVTEGAVEVSTVDGGAAEMVRPGMVAMVAASDLLQLNIEAETSRSIRSSGAPVAGVVTVPATEAGRYEGPAEAPVAVPAPVTEGDVSLGDVTDGLVAGRGGIDLALADIHDTRTDNSGAGSSAGNNGESNDGANDSGGSGNSNGGGGNDDDDDNSGSGNGGDDDDDDDSSGSGNGGDDDGDDDSSGSGNGGDDDDDGDNSGSGNGGDDDDDGDNSGSGNGGDDDDDDDNSGSGNGGDDDDDDDNSGPGNGDDDDDVEDNSGSGNGDDDDDDDNSGSGGDDDDDDDDDD